MEIRLQAEGDAEALSAFYQRNDEHLRAWEPLREEGFHAVDAWRERLRAREVEQEEGRSAYFVSVDVDSREIIATCALTNIVMGPFRACNIGYAIDAGHEGRGLMRQLCEHVIAYAFDELELNRIMANYMPRNRRSAALLEKLGFRQEGRAEKYLFINGEWEDHLLTSLLHPRQR